ncbi:histone demethylase KNAG_0D05190 [Huiozyma naganishii CBS 8797]|uniref:JmjC domain-containing protein n=1 Tax=Huiozyma naganishii (strain ATCC MYA-139 / BCRC 22969 / CBS 8797 / KCTC 17520 / NBRC 10181 / NCYC 3082 / Yp74L-3) TaxID=1071383 RepID=J7RYL1_HUIN7|nr:hypothetical protein KNAG_0D05190 [Kazachstania naganishii CBS 8797]CCK70257.1 hypothetical protein KNAG_0D05190 [Kazachstania naganishii CBS 8797]
MECKNVPVLHPTLEELANPIDYLSQRHIKQLGIQYGLLKLVTPDGFQYPRHYRNSSIKFCPRLQKLSYLDLLNRNRLFFFRQLNNYLTVKGGAKISQSYVLMSNNRQVFLYDLFIKILEFSKTEDSPKKRAKHSGDVLQMVPVKEVLRNSKLWFHLTKAFGADSEELRTIFVENIEGFYKYVYRQSQSHLYTPSFRDAYPKSLLSDSEETSAEEDEEDEEEPECCICHKNKKLQDCELCHKTYCQSCEPLTDTSACNSCILGNGYYGFAMDTQVFSIQQFKDNYSVPDTESVATLETEFWSAVGDIESEFTVPYGADIPYPKTPKNLADLSMDLLNLPHAKRSLLNYLPRDKEISGMTVPWIYVGTRFSTFCWHMEDQYTFSANYQVEGARKIWYCISPSYVDKFHSFLQKLVPDLFSRQKDIMHQLVSLVPPDVLIANGIPVYRAVQTPGEFIVTFPKCYHAGFNAGYNLNEAVNFINDFWLDYGLEADAEYRLTNKRSVFDMNELMIVILRDFTVSSTFDGPLVRNCFRSLLNAVNRTMKLLTLLGDNGERKVLLPVEDSKKLIGENEIYCTHCQCICTFAFVSPGKFSSVTEITALQEDQDDPLQDIFCIEDSITLCVGKGSVYFVQDMDEVNALLRNVGTKLDKCC